MVGADGKTGVVLAVLILLSVVAPLAGTGTAAASHRAALAPMQVDADDVLLAAHVQADGDARWRVAYRIRLDDQNTTEAFESLQQDIRQNPENFTSTFRQRMARTAQAAENATGREMAIRNVTVSAEKKSLPQGTYGVITYRFTWTNFAVAEGDRLRIGDALHGLFLDELTTLLISWPEQYRVVSVEPRGPAQLGSNRVTWEGPLEFVGDEPTLTLTTAPATATPAGPSIGGLPVVPITAGLVVVALGLGAAYLYASGRPRGPSEGAGETGGGPGGGPGDEAMAGVSAEAAAEEAAATGGGEFTPQEESEGPSPELLSNEEQVLRLLDQHGGRMKQQQIVSELDWTEAKTSQVVGDLREEGEIETFRIGRENVVTLPQEEE